MTAATSDAAARRDAVGTIDPPGPTAPGEAAAEAAIGVAGGSLGAASLAGAWLGGSDASVESVAVGLAVGVFPGALLCGVGGGLRVGLGVGFGVGLGVGSGVGRGVAAGVPVGVGVATAGALQLTVTLLGYSPTFTWIVRLPETPPKVTVVDAIPSAFVTEFFGFTSSCDDCAAATVQATLWPGTNCPVSAVLTVAVTVALSEHETAVLGPLMCTVYGL